MNKYKFKRIHIGISRLGYFDVVSVTAKPIFKKNGLYYFGYIGTQHSTSTYGHSIRGRQYSVGILPFDKPSTKTREERNNFKLGRQSYHNKKLALEDLDIMIIESNKRNEVINYVTIDMSNHHTWLKNPSEKYNRLDWQDAYDERERNREKELNVFKGGY